MKESLPMVVSDPLSAFDRKSMVKLIAPAKVNLYLDIGEKRPDGYHEVMTVMHALSLHDVLHMDHVPETENGLEIALTCYARELLEPLAVAVEDNIVTKAIRLLAAKIGRDVNETLNIRIEKHIPSEAGLGGGSSDAAAALVGVAKIWGLAPDAPEIMAAAQELGADVSFFLYGGCACLTGVGEALDHKLSPMKKAVALIKPAGGVSTAAAYRDFDKAPDVLSPEQREHAFSAQQAEDVPLANNLVQASEELNLELGKIKHWLDTQVGIEASLMSGSGSAIFAICETFEEACRIVAAARDCGWWARSTSFSSVRAAVVPGR